MASQSTEEFVYRSNVTKFTRQLAAARSESERKKIMGLLEEEHKRAKAAGWMRLPD